MNKIIIHYQTLSLTLTISIHILSIDCITYAKSLSKHNILVTCVCVWMYFVKFVQALARLFTHSVCCCITIDI